MDKILSLKVAARYAATRPMKPEKMTALLMKLRKGAGTSLLMKALIPVFDHLGGWLIEDINILVPENREYSNASAESVERTYSNPHPGNVQTRWETAKAQEVKQLPDPERAKPYATFYMGISAIETNSSGNPSFTYRAWQVLVGTKVTAPNGKSVTINETVDKFLDSYPSNLFAFGTKERFSDWLRKDTPFLDQINEKLGTDSLELESQKRVDKRREELKEIARTKKNIGECSVCEGMFRLLPKTRNGKDKSMPGMVLHGYKRPGTGYIHNNCPGEFWPPFEMSVEGAAHYLRLIEVALSQMEAELKIVERRDLVVLPDPNNDDKKYTKSEMDPKDWDLKYDEEIKARREKVADLKREVHRFQKKIAAWEPLPLNLDSTVT